MGAGPQQQASGALAALGQFRFPIRVQQLQFRRNLLPEGLGGRIEKLEFEQVPKFKYLLPEQLRGTALCFAFRYCNQGQFDEGFVHEEVHDGIAVVAGHSHVARFNAVDGGRSPREAGDDALTHHQVQQLSRILQLLLVQVR